MYMIDLVDGVIPSTEDKKGDIEEAVRLFYVGMTRAKRHLELISYQQRDGGENNGIPICQRCLEHHEPIEGNRHPGAGTKRKNKGC